MRSEGGASGGTSKADACLAGPGVTVIPDDVTGRDEPNAARHSIPIMTICTIFDKVERNRSVGKDHEFMVPPPNLINREGHSPRAVKEIFRPR